MTKLNKEDIWRMEGSKDMKSPTPKSPSSADSGVVRKVFLSLLSQSKNHISIEIIADEELITEEDYAAINSP